MNATIIGYHGRRNLGDDVFLRIAIKLLASSIPLNRVFVAGFQDRIADEIEGVKVSPYEVEGNPIARFVWLQTFFYGLRSRLIVFAAGSIFTVLPFFLVYFILLLLKTFKPSMQIVALGVSIGPLHSRFDRFWCKRLVRLFDRIVLRDSASLELLREIGAHGRYEVAHDLALLRRPLIQRWEAKNVVGLCLGSQVSNSMSAENGAPDLCDALALAVSRLYREFPGVVVRIYVACGDATDGDKAIAERMQSRLAELEVPAKFYVYDGLDPDSFITNISECSAVVTSRMHVGVFAMMCAVPTLQIAYARKIVDFYMQCGIGRQNLVSPEDLTTDATYAFLDAAMNGALERLAASRMAKLQQCGEELLVTVTSLCKDLAARNRHG